MIKTGLLVAPNLDWLAKFREEVDSGDVKLFISDENVDNVVQVLEQAEIDVAVLGYYTEAEQVIVQAIAKRSPNTLICCLGEETDANWFVSGLIKGLNG